MPFAPAPKPARPSNPVAFEEFLDTALRTAPAPGMSHALKSGVDVYGICRYAAGAVTVQERAEIETQINDHPWAHSRVVALVKGAREKRSLADRVLHAARREAWCGLIDTVSADPEAELAKLIDSIG